MDNLHQGVELRGSSMVRGGMLSTNLSEMSYIHPIARLILSQRLAAVRREYIYKD